MPPGSLLAPFLFYFLYFTDMQFTIERTRFGLYKSVNKDGKDMVFGLTEDAVRWVTVNIHIPVLQGTFDDETSVPRSSVVAGKL